MSPDRTGDDVYRAEGHPYFGSGYAQPIPFRLAFESIGKVSDKTDKETEQGYHACRRMEVKDSLDRSHFAFSGRDKQSRIGRKTHQYDHHRSNQDFFFKSTTSTTQKRTLWFTLQKIFREKP